MQTGNADIVNSLNKKLDTIIAILTPLATTSKLVEQIASRKHIPQDNEYLNTEHAAAYLGLSKQRLDIWRCRGGGPKLIKLEQAVHYKRTDLEEFMNQHIKTKEKNNDGQ